tara:strand:- start:174 stop:347 length:174 start_codon:yes stop_codon:yes gene_type:complete
MEQYILSVSRANNIYALDIEEINQFVGEINDYIDNGIKDLERLTIPEFVRTLEKEVA